MPLPPVEFRTFAPNGVDLHVALAGPEDGPLVVLLHGFPEFWYGWKNQIGPLVAAGYRVVAPNQRGYDRSAKPDGLKAYDKDDLAADILGIIRALGRDKASIVCHDWGGVIGWWLAMQHPESVERLVVLNIPHPIAMARALKTLRQLRKSWYIFFFQLPWLPEWILSRNDHALLHWMITAASPPGTWTEPDLARYHEAWSQPGAVHGMLQWYRAAARVKSAPMRSRRVTAPTLVLWGDRDVALGKELADASIAFCDDGRLVHIPEAGHFVQHDAAAEVNTRMLEFLGGKAASAVT